MLPYLQALSVFRDDVRRLTRNNASKQELLALCDQLRDDVLPELGVRLEDREGGAALIKLDDRETLLKERAVKREVRARNTVNACRLVRLDQTVLHNPLGPE